MPRQNKKPAASKAKKKPTKKQSSWPPSFLRTNLIPIIFIAAFALVGGIIAVFSAMAATTTSGNEFVSAVNSTKCLDNSRNVKLNSNKIQLYECNKTEAQSWTANSNGTITNINGYCLDAKYAGTQPKTIVQLYECNQTKAQQWALKPDGTIVNPNSGLCLDDKYSGTANGNQIWLWTCNGTNAQKWNIKSLAPPTTTPPPSTGGGSGGGTGGSGGGSGGNTGGGTSSGNNPSGQAMPTGSIAGWKQIFADDFTGTVPKGAFSDCNHNTDSPQAYCGGLKNYGNYYANWWAYPNGWADTAKSGADGNTGAPYGGVYHPEDTVSVSNGAMHINMFRPKSGGDNHVASVVPRACMAHQYGRYTERFKVVHADPGFKSAHLFYDGGYEIDYPENDYGDTISAYTHPGEANFGTNSRWTDWHTTTIEWTANSVKFYLDGKLIGTTSTKVPRLKMSWILQNESSIMGPYAKPGASAQLDIDWVSCYSPA